CAGVAGPHAVRPTPSATAMAINLGAVRMRSLSPRMLTRSSGQYGLRDVVLLLVALPRRRTVGAGALAVCEQARVRWGRSDGGGIGHRGRAGDPLDEVGARDNGCRMRSTGEQSRHPLEWQGFS